MKALRNPESGCPWDIQQDFSSVAPYTLEEAYEVADAIAVGDMDGLRDELGDLLFQVVFHARMAEEMGAFDFTDVVTAICDKMIRRHPHVFGSEEEKAAGATEGSWERIKAAERSGKVAESSAIEGVAKSLPALKRAEKLGKRASRVGFDWPDTVGVTAKIDEELAELAQARNDENPEQIAAEFGDVMFSLVNLARHLDVDPEAALAATNRKFEHRFRQVEAQVSESGRKIEDLDIDALEALWQKAKQA